MNDAVNLSLYPWQHEAWFAEEPYVATVTPIGEGKSWFGAHRLIARAWQFPEALHLATGNGYPHLRDTVIPELERAIEDFRLDYTREVVNSNILIHLGNGETAKILVRSTETKRSVDRLRSLEVGTWWGDEVRDASRYAFDVIMGRLRGGGVDRERAFLTTTPNGYDWVWQLFVDEPDSKPELRAKRRLIHVTKRQNHRLREDYDEDLRSSYSDEYAQQELEAAFVAMGVGRCHKDFDRTLDVDSGLKYNPAVPAMLCVDFNLNPGMGWEVVQDASAGELHVIDEVFARRATIDDAVVMLAGMPLPGHPGKTWKDHEAGWQVFGDATKGTSRHTGRTDWYALMESLKAHGFKHVTKHVRSSNPHPKDRINAVNGKIRNAQGRRFTRVHPRCKELIRDFEQGVWKNGDLDPGSDNARGHWAAAFGYMVEKRFPVRGKVDRERMAKHDREVAV